MWWEVGVEVVVQRVRRGVREVAVRRRCVWREEGVRILLERGG